jgi:hypothetical protein
MRSKSESLEMFRKFNEEEVRSKGGQIGQIHSDNGTEYRNKAFISYCNVEKISRRYSSAYTPQQNGVAERYNRTIATMARAMLLQKNLKPSYWAKAFQHANYVNNMLSHSANTDFKSPHELMHGAVPDIDRLRVFGSEAYVMKPGRTSADVDPYAFKGLYIGNDMYSPMFIIYDYRSNKTIRSSNVIINELEVNAYNIIKDSDKYVRVGSTSALDISKIVLEPMGVDREIYECSNHECRHIQNDNVDTHDDAPISYTQPNTSVPDTYLSVDVPENDRTTDSSDQTNDDGYIVRKSSRIRHKPNILTMEKGGIWSDKN